MFKDLRKDIGFGPRVVDIKRTEVESADEIARAIERAEKTLGAARALLHPDCGFWILSAHGGRQASARWSRAAPLRRPLKSGSGPVSSRSEIRP